MRCAVMDAMSSLEVCAIRYPLSTIHLCPQTRGRAQSSSEQSRCGQVG